ncbi:MAG: hypothetical protein ACREUL_01805 [Steroidobacteraceae bacterium]
MFNSGEIRQVAKQQVLALHQAGYRPPVPARRIHLAGRTGVSSIKIQLVNMLERHLISAFPPTRGSVA